MMMITRIVIVFACMEIDGSATCFFSLLLFFSVGFCCLKGLVENLLRSAPEKFARGNGKGKGWIAVLASLSYYTADYIYPTLCV